MAIQINDYPLTLAIDNREFSCAWAIGILLSTTLLAACSLNSGVYLFAFPALDPIPFQKNPIGCPARGTVGHLTLQAGRQGAREIRRAHVAQQNSGAKTVAELHPIREVSGWRWPD